MRNKVVAFTILLLLNGHPQAAWSAESTATSGPPDKGRGAWLIGILRQIANDGNLTDAASVSRALHVKLKLASHPSVRTAGGECAAASDAYVPLSVTNYLPEEPSWFRPTAEGVRYAVTPGGGPRRATAPGETPTATPPPTPKLEYEIAKGECHGPAKIAERVSAVLFFDQLQAVACITEADLKKFLPDVRRDSGLDGSVPYSYLGRRDSDGGTKIRFQFWGAPCLSEIWMESAWRYGFGH